LRDAAEPSQNRPPNLTLHGIFAGPEGLRAGWGLLLFVLLFEISKALLYPMLMPVLPHLGHPGQGMSPARVLPLEGAGLLCAGASTWLLARIENRRFSDYGLSDPRRLRHFVEGAIWGAVLLSALVFWLHAMGALAFDGRLLFGSAALRYAAVWLSGFVVIGFFEELLFRGYAQYTIARGVRGICVHFGVRHAAAAGFWIAALLTSFYFGFGHGTNAGESPIGLVAAGLVGLVFCFSIWRTGSLWWAIGFHTIWDWMESFVYGLGDSGSTIQGHLLAMHPTGRPLLSGGATGPEGSILIVPILLLSACAVLLSPPRAGGDESRFPYRASGPEAAEDVSLH
jgi:hypothetical protein